MELADNLRLLAYSDVEDRARTAALNTYLDKPQVALGVRQRCRRCSYTGAGVVLEPKRGNHNACTGVTKDES